MKGGRKMKHIVKFDCGCEIREEGYKSPEIYYCPKHKAAPEMHERLEQNTKYLEYILAHYSLSAVSQTMEQEVVENKAALAKAKGEK